MILNKKLQSIRASGIREIFQAKKDHKDLVDFSLGQPDFDTPQFVKNAMVKNIQAGRNSYAENQGILPLRQAVARKLQEKNGITADPEEVIITVGTTGGLVLSLFTFLNPGDEVIIPDPCFVLYRELPKLLGAKPVMLDTYPNFQVDPKKLAALITKRTRILILNTPNAPTGQIYNKKVLREIAGLARKHNLIIIADEIYEDFIYDQREHVSIGSFYEQTITLNGFSKSYGLPGWRIGYMHTPRQYVPEMIKLQQFLYACAPTPAQHALVDVFSHISFTRDIQIQYQKKRDMVDDILSDHFVFPQPVGSFYVFCQAPGKNATEFCRSALKEGVVLVPGNIFSRHDTHFRLCFAAKDEVLIKGLKRLTTFI